MIRSSIHSRRMAWLALAAVLLMATAPTVSRVLASVAGQAGAVLVEMCTAAGLKTIDVSGLLDTRDQVPASGDATDDMCGYCALAPPLALVLLLLCVLAPPRPMRVPLPHRPPLFRPVRNRRGLGSQAPPIAL
jgi:hypothetical protein